MSSFAMIIEDDRRLSDIFGEAVKAAGYEVTIIQDGNEAVEQLKTTVPDLVVLDLHLPGVMGPEILTKIRADARLAKTRVVIATADASLANDLRDEFDLLLLKPISVEQLQILAGRLRPS